MVRQGPQVIPICHIFNRCLISGRCPELGKESKIIPKDSKTGFAGSNCSPILPVLSKMLENFVFKQMFDHFNSNGLQMHSIRIDQGNPLALH